MTTVEKIGLWSTIIANVLVITGVFSNAQDLPLTEQFCTAPFKFMLITLVFSIVVGLIYWILTRSNWDVVYKSIAYVITGVILLLVLFSIPGIKCAPATSAVIAKKKDSAATIVPRMDTLLSKPQSVQPGTLIPKMSKHKSAKPSSPTINQMHVDSGGSGLQNNAPNYGQQAGRDITNYGILPRTLSNSEIEAFFRLVPDKDALVDCTSFGTPTTDELRLKTQILGVAARMGFKNIFQDFRIIFGATPPEKIYFNYDTVGHHVQVLIPPAP